MNRITIDVVLWIALLTGAMAQHGNHTRLQLRAPGPEPKPMACVFCR